MFRPFDTEKSLAAAAVLLRGERAHVMSKLRLLTLLYLADREALKETGRPLLGFRLVAAEHGPVHAALRDLLEGQHIEEPRFAAFFRHDGYRVELSVDPGVASLSRYEIGKLQEVGQRYEGLSDWELANGVARECPEWRKNYAEGEPRVIPLADVVDAVGRGSDRAAILQDLTDQAAFDRLFQADPVTVPSSESR